MHYNKVFYMITDAIILCRFFFKGHSSTSKMTGLYRLGMTVLKNHFTCSKRYKIDNQGCRKRKKKKHDISSRKLQLYLFLPQSFSWDARPNTQSKITHHLMLHSSFHFQMLPLLTIIHQFCLFRGSSGLVEKQYTAQHCNLTSNINRFGWSSWADVR